MPFYNLLLLFLLLYFLTYLSVLYLSISPFPLQTTSHCFFFFENVSYRTFTCVVIIIIFINIKVIVCSEGLMFSCSTGRCQSTNTLSLTVTLIVEYGINTNYMCLWVSCCWGLVVLTSPPVVGEDSMMRLREQRVQLCKAGPTFLTTVSESDPLGFKLPHNGCSGER